MSAKLKDRKKLQNSPK